LFGTTLIVSLHLEALANLIPQIQRTPVGNVEAIGFNGKDALISVGEAFTVEGWNLKTREQLKKRWRKDS
jgi:hypothetical protein